MNNFKKTAIAALTIATVSATTMGASVSSAQAGKIGGKVLGGIAAGLVIGGIISHASRSHGHGYQVRECWYETRKRWDHDGYPYYVKVKLCD